MTFSNPGRAAEQNILMAGDESTGSQVLDQGAVDSGSSQEIKGCQGFETVTARERQTVNQVLLAASLQFIIEQQGQEFKRAELAFNGLGRPQVEGLLASRTA